MKSLLLVVLCVVLCPVGKAEKWRFVVAGDGRADGKTVRKEDKNGINAVITGEMAQAVIEEKAKFLAWTGDLVIGNSTDEAKFESQLMTWREIMQPVYDKHIPVLATRGNHDAGTGNNDKAWRKVFSGKYAMPNNGPAKEKDYTFSFAHESVLLIGLDQYSGKRETVNQPWLDSVLKANKKPFVFAFAHEPAFMDGAHKDNMDSDSDARDAFWESLIKAGSRVYFCGHDHLYDHMSVTREKRETGPVMHQITAGTSGAPFYAQGEYTGSNSYFKLKREAHIDNTYGYLVVEIDGKKCTVTFKGRVSPGVYKAMDSFSYSVAK